MLMLREFVKKLLRWLGICQAKRVDFITLGESLPTPMTAEEEQDAIQRMLSGDDNARLALIERNLRLVVYIAKKFDNTRVELDDLVSIGTIGLIKSISGFDPSKNIKLATFASRCIENEILMHLRKTSKMKVEVSLYEPLNVDYEGNMLMLSDVLGSDPDEIYHGIEEQDEKEMLRQTFSKLGKRDREIVQKRFGLDGEDEMTQKEIAEMMGISQSYISRLEKKILVQLKKEILKLGT
ncbi:MAG: RNA polymerase sporulation sigma factor SigK [Clostridia bacterium]|nr:RNA polymerase sporulation sigma factor SigK [Clostridia bacterium]MBO7151678.1 RNA polymerase sporulation sigma factor SigK [Clostridia bacterium]